MNGGASPWTQHIPKTGRDISVPALTQTTLLAEGLAPERVYFLDQSQETVNISLERTATCFADTVSKGALVIDSCHSLSPQILQVLLPLKPGERFIRPLWGSQVRASYVSISCLSSPSRVLPSL